MSSIISLTTTDIRQSIRSAGSITVANEYAIPKMNEELDEADDSYLPENHGVTGHEPNTNPTHWLTNHRRLPPHRSPVAHPQWVAIGGPLSMRIFLWNMFSGCQLLQWGYSIASVTGLHDRGFCMYKIANEW